MRLRSPLEFMSCLHDPCSQNFLERLLEVSVMLQGSAGAGVESWLGRRSGLYRVCVWLRISSLPYAASEPPIKLTLLEPNFSLGWKWDSSTYGRTWGGIGILDVVYITNVQGRYTKSTNEAAMHSTSSQNRQYEERCGVKSETVGFQSRVANQSPFRVI